MLSESLPMLAAGIGVGGTIVAVATVIITNKERTRHLELRVKALNGLPEEMAAFQAEMRAKVSGIKNGLDDIDKRLERHADRSETRYGEMMGKFSSVDVALAGKRDKDECGPIHRAGH